MKVCTSSKSSDATLLVLLFYYLFHPSFPATSQCCVRHSTTHRAVEESAPCSKSTTEEHRHIHTTRGVSWLSTRHGVMNVYGGRFQIIASTLSADLNLQLLQQTQFDELEVCRRVRKVYYLMYFEKSLFLLGWLFKFHHGSTMVAHTIEALKSVQSHQSCACNTVLLGCTPAIENE